MIKLSRTTVTAAVLLGAAACTNDVTNPTQRLSPTAGARNAAPAASPFHKNSEKYSDRGAKPATGRSGSASLQTRALLGKDGQTVVEATTGDLEAGTMPGQISKMQLKILSPNDSLAYTQNYNGLTGNGYWTGSYSGFGRDEQVQTQANVRGIDGKRNDVVTVATQIKLRPDLAVSGVTAPAQAFPNAAVNVSALVSELNHDVGAHARCVLAVDGVATDQAEGIWVDAGDAVSCAFQISIAQLGTHQLAVSATNVAPGDWDVANNSASTSIEIVPPETPLDYSTSVTQQDYDYQNNYSYNYYWGASSGRNETGTRHDWSWGFSGWTEARSVAFPVTVHAALSGDNGSAVDATGSVALSSWYYQQCGNTFVNGVSISVCGGDGSYYGHRTQVSANANGGHVTYFGNYFDGYYGYYGYAYNGDYSYGAGPVDFGSAAHAVVELTDANGAMFAARPTITLTQSPIASDWNYCYSDWWYYYEQDCYNGFNHGTTHFGSAFDYTHP